MADKLLKVALVLSAVDKMSRTIGDAVSKSQQHINKLKKAAGESFMSGSSQIGAGSAMAATLLPVINAYKDLEDSSVKLKSVMLRDGNKIDETLFGKVNAEAIRLGNLLPGTTADFQNLFSTMLETGVEAQSILNGSGQAAAYLAVQMGMGTEEAGKLAGKLQNAMSVPDKDMMQMMDFIARMKNVNVEAGEMQFAFAKSSMALKMLGVQGLKDSKIIGNLFAQMISTGQTGETVGTNFGRILQSILNPKKFEKFQTGMKAVGLSMDFFDSNGKFKGIENFVTEFAKLNGMDVQTIAKLLEPLTGGEGVDSGFLTALSMNGVESFNKMNKRLFEQATLTDKVTLRLTTFKNMWEATQGTFENFLAAVGESFAPEMKGVVDWLGRASAKMQGFANNNKGLSKIIVSITLIIASLLTLSGVIAITKAAFLLMAATSASALGGLNFALFALRYNLKFNIWPAIVSMWTALTGFAASVWAAVLPAITAMITATWAWTAALLANPLTWIVLAVVAAIAILAGGVYLIIKHWDKISAFFKKVWAGIKRAFIAGWNWLKANWKTVLMFLINPFGAVFTLIMLAIKKFFPKMYAAGKNIMKQIWEGMKSLASKPVEMISDVVKKMRDFLPFSPAKRGAFRDLHKVKIMETIALGMKPGPLVNAMSQATGAAIAPISRPQYTGGGPGGNGGMTITFAPVIHLNGTASNNDAKLLTSSMKVEFEKLIKQYLANQKRTSY